MIRTTMAVLLMLCCISQAMAQAIYSNIPPVLAGNYPSLGYQATQTAEFGDRITFAGTDRRLQTVTVTMSSWARSEDYGGAESFTHPLTMNIYDAGSGGAHGSLIATLTHTFTIPYRPTGWGFNGIAFNATFDFSSLNIVLPDTIVYGLAYNTQTWGAAPLGVAGPYNSLNFAVSTDAGGGVTVGANDDLDDVFWNTCTAANYTDGGAGGTCTFRRDTGWLGFTPMAQFVVSGSNLELNATSECAGTSQLVVDIDLSNAAAPVVGGQFFLEFDTTKLDFVSAVPAPSIFTVQLLEAVNEGAGTIDYATGVIPGSGLSATSGRMARITFNVTSGSCYAADLVRFRSHSPPTRVTDENAASVLPLALADLDPIILNDTTAPALTVPADITVKSDAGLCSAVVEYTAFATDNCNPSFPFSETGAAGSFSTGDWNVDRYAPCVWTAGAIDPVGGSALHLGICNSDRFENRPVAFQSDFYNTQGRQRSSSLPQGWEVKGELFIPADWTTPGNLRRSDLWARDNNPVENDAIYAIVGFINNDPAAPFDSNAANFQPRFRVWDGATVGWIDLPVIPTLLNQYNSVRIVDTGASYEYYINGVLAHTLTGASYSSPAGYGLQTTFIEAYNFGVPSGGAHGAIIPLADSSYDVYWREVSAVWTASPVTLVCSPPSGSTFTAAGSPHTVTCTATDPCGNVTMDTFTVTVQPVTPVLVDVRLADVSTGTYTRCITLQTSHTSGMCAPASTSATLSFTDGLAHAIVDVPCGSYNCITARDPLHTLRMTDVDDFTIVGAHYVADFSDADTLPGGNLNDDEVIDILDFGGLVGDFGTVYASPSTTCATSPIHADISGDRFVDGADFSYIQINFLDAREPNCCGAPSNQPQPVLDIAIEELFDRNMPGLVVADLNHDGRLNTEDVASFLDGARASCPADWNGDAAITSHDLFHFVETFFGGRADFNRDRATDSRDFFEFMTAFFRGC